MQGVSPHTKGYSMTAWPSPPLPAPINLDLLDFDGLITPDQTWSPDKKLKFWIFTEKVTDTWRGGPCGYYALFHLEMASTRAPQNVFKVYLFIFFFLGSSCTEFGFFDDLASLLFTLFVW